MFVPAGVVAASIGDLLDHFPTSIHSAFSMRKFNSYAGFGFRIRRTVDDVEADLYYDDVGDISFDSVVSNFSSSSSSTNLGEFMAKSGYTDQDSLGAVASARVVTWKDQSGGGRDVTQATEAYQPLLVHNAVITTENGVTALDFDIDFLQHTDASSYSQPNTYMLVIQSDVVGSSDYIIDGDASGDRHVIGHSSSRMKIHADDWAGTASANTNQNLWFVMVNGASTAIHINGASDSAGGEDAGDYSMSGLTIGARYSGSNNWHGRVQEIIYYRGNQSGTRAGMEFDINRYYGIY